MMCDEWTHSMCWRCWINNHPGQHPVRLKDPKKEKCCYCGDETNSGIFTRDAPMKKEKGRK